MFSQPELCMAGYHKMSLIRTFHPVGQGAFYEERHSFGDNEFTIVYDCGSKTLGKKLLDRE